MKENLFLLVIQNCFVDFLLSVFSFYPRDSLLGNFFLVTFYYLIDFYDTLIFSLMSLIALNNSFEEKKYFELRSHRGKKEK